MADVNAEVTLPAGTPAEPGADTEVRAAGDTEQPQNVNDEAAADENSLPIDENVVPLGDIGDPNDPACRENDNGTTDVVGKKEGGELVEPGGSVHNERAQESGEAGGTRDGGGADGEGVDDDKLYRRVRDSALEAINAVSAVEWGVIPLVLSWAVLARS